VRGVLEEVMVERISGQYACLGVEVEKLAEKVFKLLVVGLGVAGITAA
jgi:hypothetical protein